MCQDCRAAEQWNGVYYGYLECSWTGALLNTHTRAGKIQTKMQMGIITKELQTRTITDWSAALGFFSFTRHSERQTRTASLCRCSAPADETAAPAVTQTEVKAEWRIMKAGHWAKHNTTLCVQRSGRLGLERMVCASFLWFVLVRDFPSMRHDLQAHILIAPYILFAKQLLSHFNLSRCDMLIL